MKHATGQGNWTKVLILLSILAGILLRIRGVYTEFWLDEIWSLDLLKDIHSPVEIFSSIYSDNNHLLNSLWLYACGGADAAWPLLRALSLVTGVLTLLLVWYWGWLTDRRAAAFMSLLVSLSFPFVLYGSEARGYAALGCFALLAVCELKNYRGNEHRRAWLYWLACSGAALAHFSFAGFFVALVLWSVYRQVCEKRRLACLVRLHLVPFLVILGLYLLHFRHTPAGTGTIYDAAQVLTEVFALPFGAPGFSAARPEMSLVTLGMGLMIFCFAIAEIVSLKRRGRSEWLLYALVVILTPLLVCGFRPRVIYPRYFYLSMLFAVLLLAGFLARVMTQARAGQIFGALLLLLFVAGNVSWQRDFLQQGRGSWREAVALIVSADKSPVIEVAADQVFRCQKMLAFYASYTASGQKFHCLAREQATGAGWSLTQSQDRFFKPPSRSRLPGDSGTDFELIASYPGNQLSGGLCISTGGNSEAGPPPASCLEGGLLIRIGFCCWPFWMRFYDGIQRSP